MRMRLAALRSEVAIPALALVLLALPALGAPRFLLVLMTEMLIFGLLAMSYDLLLGVTGILSFGHALFFGAGAYAVGILFKAGAPLWVMIAAGLPVVLLAATVVGALSLRVRGIYFAMVTLAFAEFAHILAGKLYRFTGGDDGIAGIRPAGVPTSAAGFYILTVVVVALGALALFRLNDSLPGRVWSAIRENEERVRFLGFDLFRYRLGAIVASGLLAGVAGGLYALSIRFAFPALLSMDTTLKVLLMTIIGGMGSLYGPFLGAALITTLSHVVSSYVDRWPLVFGVIYVLLVLFFPTGIAGSLRRLLRAPVTPSPAHQEVIRREET